jgi:hypothetical protein
MRIFLAAFLFLPAVSMAMIQSTVRIDGKFVKKDNLVASIDTAKGTVIVPVSAVEGRTTAAGEPVAVFVDIFELVKLNPKIFTISHASRKPPPETKPPPTGSHSGPTRAKRRSV